MEGVSMPRCTSMGLVSLAQKQIYKTGKSTGKCLGVVRSTEQPLCEIFFNSLRCISLEKKFQTAVYKIVKEKKKEEV